MRDGHERKDGVAGGLTCAPDDQSGMTVTIETKRKGGRKKGSGKGRGEMISARFPPPMVERIDAMAARRGNGRSALLREFIEDGLIRAEAQGEQEQD